MKNWNRREILTGGSAIALASGFPSSEASAQAVVTRPNINSLPLNHPILNSYRTAVAAMKALPVSNLRNWTRQAQIHQGSATVRCPHGNWYFLPWHRAYLVAFERLCRQLSGNPSFALPYWNWTASPQLPAAFASPTYMGAPNPLFNPTRSSQTVTIPPSVAGPAVISGILAETSFEVFASSRPFGQTNTAQNWQIAGGSSGPLESNPHNSVHGIISGNMGTYMSPLDPIFWLHHCNIDRIWDQWNRMGRANTPNLLWRNFAFNNQFVNPSGASGTTPFNVAVSNLLNITTLGYRYVFPIIWIDALVAQIPNIPRPIDFARLPPLARAENIPLVRINVPLDIPVRFNAAQDRLFSRIQPIIVPESTQPKAVQAPGRILAIIRDIDPPKRGNAQVRVFVDCPYLTPDTSIEDRHYAGSFSFFGLADDHAGHADKLSFTVDLTETVLRLRGAQIDLKEAIKVQLMPVPLAGPARAQAADFEFKAGAVDIAII